MHRRMFTACTVRDCRTSPPAAAALLNEVRALLGISRMGQANRCPRVGRKMQLVRQATRRGQDAVIFEIRDSGSGIPPEDLPRIFERFYKSKRPKQGSGTGLGLSIAKHLVEAHGGKIWAESRLAEGSTFFISLPRQF